MKSILFVSIRFLVLVSPWVLVLINTSVNEGDSKQRPLSNIGLILSSRALAALREKLMFYISLHIKLIVYLGT